MWNSGETSMWSNHLGILPAGEVGLRCEHAAVDDPVDVEEPMRGLDAQDRLDRLFPLVAVAGLAVAVRPQAVALVSGSNLREGDDRAIELKLQGLVEVTGDDLARAAGSASACASTW